ncbi:MAG: transcriptional repressor [Bacteroidota bacterium]|nr:transcriptional repressor [Bacteroidota bacterium]
MKEEGKQILKQNQLSITEGRMKILEVFLSNLNALSHSDIESITGDSFDRVTIYRTLQVFAEKGIIHQIPTTDNSIKYALCKENCAPGHHHDNHVHFICERCHKTFCLEEVHIPDVLLPEGFRPRRAEMILSGICKQCQ